MAWKIGCMVVVAASALCGCSIHTQSGIRQVAYDFSDHAYYDRAYAPSPSYDAAPASYGTAVTPAAAPCDCHHEHDHDHGHDHADRTASVGH